MVVVSKIGTRKNIASNLPLHSFVNGIQVNESILLTHGSDLFHLNYSVNYLWFFT